MKHTTCSYLNCKQKIKNIYFSQYQCKCGYFYCPDHIATTSHKCNIDYFEKNKEELKNNNLRVKYDKVIKI